SICAIGCEDYRSPLLAPWFCTAPPTPSPSPGPASWPACWARTSSSSIVGTARTSKRRSSSSARWTDFCRAPDGQESAQADVLRGRTDHHPEGARLHHPAPCPIEHLQPLGRQRELHLP